MKRDPILYAALGLAGLGIVLSILGQQVGLLLFVLAYLLRPALREFGLTPRLTDEREAMIHSRSGDIAFVVTMLAASGFALYRQAIGEAPEEMYELIVIGIATRAVTGLVLAADYRKAGALIIAAVGFFLGVFLLLDSGFSIGALIAVVIFAMFLGVAHVARRHPVTVAIVLLLLTLGMVLHFHLYHFQPSSAPVWLFLVTPLLVSSACLFLGRGSEECAVPGKLRMLVFGGIGLGAAVVFTLTMVFGSRSDKVKEYARTSRHDAGTETIVQGLACTGPYVTWSDGSLESAVLARPDTVSGRILPKGTSVHFNRNGSFHFCFLPGDVMLDGHLCRGGGHDFTTHLYPNGQLKVIWLGREETIHNIPCAPFEWFGDVFGGPSMVEFHENGTLKRAKLARSMTLQTHTLEKGTIIQFDSTGTLLPSKP